MNRCPITYEHCGNQKFSKEGLRKLSSKLGHLHDLPWDTRGLRQEAMQRAAKLSIQGVQPKLSAVLSIKEERFEIVDRKGKFILKFQADFPEMPENEDLTMHLASIAGFDVPLHGLIHAKDQSLVFFIQRFDRKGHGKIKTEDFARLAGESRETKYNFSMERLAGIIDTYCTFPVVQKAELFKRTLFNYLVGNEDMHLKNYSVIAMNDVVRLAPVYDFLSSSIVLNNPEEIALPLDGKKRGLTRRILVTYFGQERLGLESRVIDDQLQLFAKLLPQWETWIDKSFLSNDFKSRYRATIQARAAVLGLA